uniref:Uncharacterized protein n=1 Tax=Timema tahoe TaxID=61484 RepID=A0A7R9FHK1_9NEOP|nr:unnamed protein product [Timema tahoe]
MQVATRVRTAPHRKSAEQCSLDDSSTPVRCSAVWCGAALRVAGALIVLHSSGLEDFYKIVPNEVLPKEYGGKAGPIEEAHNEVTYESTPVRDSSEKEDEE